MNSYSQWASVLRPRYVHFAMTSSIGSIFLLAPNVTLICSDYTDSAAICARKINATDGLNFYLVDPTTNQEGVRLFPAATTVYSPYARVIGDGVFEDMLHGTPNWGKVVTAQAPIVTISSYHPYMSSSGQLLGIIQGAKKLTSPES
ncbi:hypothetical protein Pelo_19594 [Pelomyxa schiedti]|nr:hypothetical protein Pelo_19594 [Pelomyxa schiedti]